VTSRRSETAAAGDVGDRLVLGAAVRRLFPVLAIAVFVAGVVVTLAVAGDTLGFDFLAYHTAASRVLAGQPAYDMSYQGAGGFGLFYYPPTFIPLVLPLGLLSADLATWLWVAGLIAAFLAGTALLPVGRTTKWTLVLLAGLSWPFVYAIKLGQVGQLLYLLFAIGWRWLDNGPVLGVSGGIGAAIKIQPGLVLAWALLTRRWSAVVTGGIVLAVLASSATLLAGPQAWTDFFALIGRVTDPITTPNNVTPGALAYQAGLSHSTAAILQYTSMAVALVVFVVVALHWPSVPSYLAAVILSQLLSPILWNHYALLLLLPVAWLLDRGHWWAVGFALVTPWLLAGAIPPWVYPAAFWTCLATVIVVGRRASTAGGAFKPVP
jgi:alpha-1,2-mannosyltransferase